MKPHSHPELNRRQFIASAIVAAAIAATHRLRATAPAMGRLDPDAIGKLRATIKGRVGLPADAAFEKARRVFFWGPKTERRPQAIVRCAHPDDIRRSIEFARSHGLEVAVRGGGHSALGWGTCHGLLVDLGGMKRVEIDPSARTVRFDAGVLGGEIVAHARRYALAPVLGVCPGVGAAGVLLGGGLGWRSGLHGAACDRLRSAHLATADGRLLHVDAQSDPDLFWALRGGGGNFGVATSLECHMVPVGPVTAGEIHYRLRDARVVMELFRDVMAEAPDSFQATLNIACGADSVFIGLCHSGSPEDAEKLLGKFRAIAVVTKDTAKTQHFADVASLPPSYDAAPPGCRYMQGIYRPRLSQELIDLILNQLTGAPAEAVLAVGHYMHGKVCRVDPDQSAFSLRAPGGVHIRVATAWQDPVAADRLVAWTDATARLLRSGSDERVYSNYQSYDGPAVAVAVFGASHSRLVSVKRKYDPDNVFRFNSNIQPAS